ncbi:MAG TPA: AbrB family transcriptional regulator [Candidatus Sulfotelmatobacter sp.]|nr:AbrB family transcriptional regulator [Candidatus Sulfotelmatobacter sp.]
MQRADASPEASSQRARKLVAEWLILLAVSAVVTVGLEMLRLPAAFLIGPMAAAILMSQRGSPVRVPEVGFLAAQAIVGCMIARSMPASVLAEILDDWPLYLPAVGSVIVATTGLGWLLMRWRILPGTTAMWGLSPGAATVMMVMASEYGADIRLVAFMQYLRVLLISLVAILFARIWTPSAAGSATAIAWFAPIEPLSFAVTSLLVVVGVIVAPRVRIPAGSLMLPFGAALALQDIGWPTPALPPWLLVGSYALIGWSTGLRFTRPILAHAVRALPQVLAAIIMVIAVCAGLAGLLVLIAHVDPLTAYLAMSPGGMDTTAIIASSSPVDLPFVMGMQTTRFFLVMLLGPGLASALARSARKSL